MGNISKVNKGPLSARAGPKNVSRKNRNICLFANTNFGFTLTFRRGKNYFTKFSRKDENKVFCSTSTPSRKGSADPKLSGGGFYRLLSIYCTGRSTQLQNRKSPKLPGEKNRWKAKAKLELGQWHNGIYICIAHQADVEVPAGFGWVRCKVIIMYNIVKTPLKNIRKQLFQRKQRSNL